MQEKTSVLVVLQGDSNPGLPSTPLKGGYYFVRPRSQGAKEPRSQGAKEPRSQGAKETRRLGDKETRRQGDKETRRQGDKETRRQGDKDIGRQGDKKIRRLGDILSGVTPREEASPRSTFFKPRGIQPGRKHRPYKAMDSLAEVG